MTLVTTSGGHTVALGNNCGGTPATISIVGVCVCCIMLINIMWHKCTPSIGIVAVAPTLINSY